MTTQKCCDKCEYKFEMDDETHGVRCKNSNFPCHTQPKNLTLEDIEKKFDRRWSLGIRNEQIQSFYHTAIANLLKEEREKIVEMIDCRLPNLKNINSKFIGVIDTKFEQGFNESVIEMRKVLSDIKANIIKAGIEI